MIIYPDIEIIDGRCAQFSRGGFGEAQYYEVTPMEAAKDFERAGAKWLHIVDLDGVMQGGRHNAELICEIIEQVDIPQGSPLVGVELRRTAIRARTKAMVIAVKYPEEPVRYTYNPGPDLVLSAGMTLIVLAETAEMNRLREGVSSGSIGTL